MLQYVDCLIHHNYVWHTNFIYLSKVQINTVSNIEVTCIRQNVFSHAIAMFILKYILYIVVQFQNHNTSETNLCFCFFCLLLLAL